LAESEHVKNLNLDMDTKRLLALRIDDILFTDADKWVQQIEQSDYVTNEITRTTPTTKNRFLKDEIGDCLDLYTKERMRYTGILKDYQRRLQELEVHEKQKAEDAAASKQTLESLAREVDPNSIFVQLARVIDDIPMSNVIYGAEYLEEGRIRKFLAANRFLYWVHKALGCGALVPGEGLERKLNECNKLRTEWETDFQDLTQRYTLLDAEYERLEWDYNMLWAQTHINPH
jgi:hypothetical protein